MGEPRVYIIIVKSNRGLQISKVRIESFDGRRR